MTQRDMISIAVPASGPLTSPPAFGCPAWPDVALSCSAASRDGGALANAPTGGLASIAGSGREWSIAGSGPDEPTKLSTSFRTPPKKPSGPMHADALLPSSPVAAASAATAAGFSAAVGVAAVGLSAAVGFNAAVGFSATAGFGFSATGLRPASERPRFQAFQRGATPRRLPTHCSMPPMSHSTSGGEADEAALWTFAVPPRGFPVEAILIWVVLSRAFMAPLGPPADMALARAAPATSTVGISASGRDIGLDVVGISVVGRWSPLSCRLGV
mmetsp:Transcript_33218/g.91934  ORF Transcript_33218/g.91934 Transcript_33218/m.91934 type:complete len:272 (+) Transcript_33218:1207-2022(+)